MLQLDMSRGVHLGSGGQTFLNQHAYKGMVAEETLQQLLTSSDTGLFVHDRIVKGDTEVVSLGQAAIFKDVEMPTTVPSEVRVTHTAGVKPGDKEVVYRTAAEVFLRKPLGRPVHIFFHHQSLIPVPQEHDKGSKEFRVFVHATSHAQRNTFRAERYIFGVPTCKDRAKPPRALHLSGDGVEIIRSHPNNVYGIAEIFPHCLYISFDLLSLPHGAGMVIFRKILERAAAVLTTPAALVEYEARQEAKRLKIFVGKCIAADRQYAETLTKEAETHQKNAERALQTYLAEMKTREDKVAEAKFLFNRTQLEDELIELYKRVIRMPDVKSVVFSRGRIVAETRTLFVHNRQANRWFRLGEFRITIFTDGSNGGVICENLTGKIGTNDAPHITNGKGCLGQFGPKIPDLIQKKAYEETIALAIQYIQWQSSFDSGVSNLERWPEATDEEIREIQARRLAHVA